MGFDEVNQKMSAVVHGEQDLHVYVTLDQTNPGGWIGDYNGNGDGGHEFVCEAPLSPDDPNRLEYIPEGESNIIIANVDFYDGNNNYLYTMVTRDTLVSSTDGSGMYYTYTDPNCQWVLPDSIRIGVPGEPPGANAFCATICHGSRSIPIVCETGHYNEWGPDSIEVTVTNGCLFDPESGHYCNSDCAPVDWNLFSWRNRVFPNCVLYLSMTYCGQGPGCVCIWRSDRRLPVEMSSFSATPGDGQVTLNWATGSESQLSRFRISRSTSESGGYSFIGAVGAENSATGASYAFVDHNVLNGTTYYYKLHVEDANGGLHVYNIDGAIQVRSATPQVGLVDAFSVSQNYPNPFNSQTSFSFGLPANDHVTLKVYDLLGREVATVVNRDMPKGNHSINWSADGLATGVYVYKLTTSQFSDTKKLLFLK
jgi:hypothetical protein